MLTKRIRVLLLAATLALPISLGCGAKPQTTTPDDSPTAGQAPSAADAAAEDKAAEFVKKLGGVVTSKSGRPPFRPVNRVDLGGHSSTVTQADLKELVAFKQTFWPRRLLNVGTFASTNTYVTGAYFGRHLYSDEGCEANPPWNWDENGAWFLTPGVEPFLVNPYTDTSSFGAPNCP